MAREAYEPRWIAWEITGRCNLSCIHCRSSSGLDSDSGDVSLKEARGWMDQMASFHSPVVVLSGGEPLMREDWTDLALHGTQKGIRVCLATNGVLVDDHVCRQIREVGIRMVSLSLDGSTESIHDDFRQQPGAFRAVLRAAEHFRRHEIPFLVNSSFTQRNQADIPNVFRLAKEIGATAWYMFMIVPTGRGEGALEELISAEEYERILNWHYEQERNENSILMRPTCAPHYFRILRERSAREGRDWKPRSLRFATGISKGCLAGQHIAFIDRFGQVKPCSYFPETAGSLREQSFRDIWEGSPLFAALRDPANYQGKCGMCEYLRVCGGCRARASAMNQGNYLGEEPFCNYQPRKGRSLEAPAGSEET